MRLKVLVELTYAGKVWVPGSLIWAWKPDALDMINRDMAEPFHLEDPSDISLQDKVDYMLPAFPPVSLSPTSATADALGGSASFNVAITGPGQVNTWTVTKEAGANWITALSPATPQPVDGAVNYTVAPNTDVERTANLYVNGVVFPITQSDGTITPMKK